MATATTRAGRALATVRCACRAALSANAPAVTFARETGLVVTPYVIVHPHATRIMTRDRCSASKYRLADLCCYLLPPSLSSLHSTKYALAHLRDREAWQGRIHHATGILAWHERVDSCQHPAMTSLLAPASPFHRPLFLHTILTQPTKTLARLLDLALDILRVPPSPSIPPIRIVCLSDTHCLKAAHVPHGELLIHAGDLTNAGTPREIQSQIDWLDSLPHQQKVVIAGNHDTYLDPRSRKTLSAADTHAHIDWRSLRYLQHSSITLSFHNNTRELNIYGAPQIPACGGDPFAFQYPRGHDAWSETVPADTDILVTHTPPKHHLDLPAALGCEHLLAELWRVQPLAHIFGHVHAGRSEWLGRLRGGREVVRWCGGQAALERILSRSDGLARGLWNPRNWVDLVMVVWHGAAGVVWERVWGGGSHATMLVNASLMYNSTGELRNVPQVVEV